MKLVVTPPALAELHDAAAFYTVKANVELGLALNEQRQARRIDRQLGLQIVLAGKELPALQRNLKTPFRAFASD